MLHRLLLLLLFMFASAAAAQDGRGYVGSDVCTACHTDVAEAWKDSHHALAWTEADPANIRADFDGTEFTLGDMTARFRIGPDGTHSVSVTETDGATSSYRVHSVVGVEPLQQYLLETEPGRLQSFDVVWDTEKGGWFHLYPDQDLPPDDGLHWTGPYKTWNGRCAECHATGFQKNFNPTTGRYGSTQVEIGVGCEACHGPGRAHVDWTEAGQPAPHPENYGFAVDFSDPEAAIQQCATCHSRREAHLDGNPMPGTLFDDAYNLALLRPGLYYADGQIEDEVYVYGSFLQSKMYARGVSCGDCHEPHAAELKAEGNAVCTQCHGPAGNPDFPTLKPALYDSPEHHRHPEGSAGAECKSCHMGERVYMGNDWRADHSFRVPRPDLSAQTGAPDTCTTCHEDRSADWAAETIADWFPESDNRGPHFGVTLARGREDAVSAAGDVTELALDTEQPGIARATALWLLEQANSPSAAERLVPLLEDPDPVVRAAAVGVQRMAPPQDRVLRLVGLLDDPIKTVRIEAAKAMLDAPIARMPGRITEDFRAAMADWQGALRNRADFPETHLQMAGMALTMRNFNAATAAFREVVRLDPQRTEAWVMIVRIAAATEGPAAAETVLEQALAINPEDETLRAMMDELQGASRPSDSLPDGGSLTPPLPE
ncbi:multiheme c-type cytochrome [Halovulum sp. GXIMD14794]